MSVSWFVRVCVCVCVWGSLCLSVCVCVFGVEQIVLS